MGLSPVKDGQEHILKMVFHKPAAIVNCQQLITVTGTPTGGTFKLKSADPVGTYETISIAYNAAAATVQSALETLTPIGSGNVSVTGSAGGPWTVEFIVDLAGTPIPLLFMSVNALTGGSSPSVTVTSSVVGVGTIEQYYYLGLSQSDRTTLGETVTLSTVNEVTGTGYARKPIKTDSAEWVALFTGGFWQVTSAVANFTAAAGNWTIQKALFICTVPTGTSGRIIDLRDITPITLADTETQGYDGVVRWQNTA